MPKSEKKGPLESISTEALLDEVITRMSAVQLTESGCREYAQALMKARKAREWLAKKEGGLAVEVSDIEERIVSLEFELESLQLRHSRESAT